MEVAVIDLYCLKPVIDARLCAVAVVSCSHCRHLMIWFHAFGACCRKLQLTSRIIYEVILLFPVNGFIILSSEHRMAFRRGDHTVITCNVVRHEVYDYPQSSLMNSLYEILEFIYSIFWIISKIRIDIIVVADCIRRTCFSLYELRVGCYASIFGALCRMADHAG